MNYIIFDMEWNQPLVHKKRVMGLDGEIIQIGAIKANENLEIIDEINLAIHPFFYQKINKEIGELTGITQEDLDNAKLSFKDAILEFKKFIGNDSIFISWSFSDISMLENNLDKYEMDKLWLPECYDAQIMFDDQEMGEGRDFALNYALYHFNEKPESSHDALDDAKSTLKIFSHLDHEGELDNYYSWSYNRVFEDDF